MKNELLYKIGLTLIDGVGDVNAKKLVAYCGGVENVFAENKKNLMKIPGVGSVLADSITSQKVLLRAEEEIKFIEKNNIKPLFFLDEDYPKRLKNCHDSPVMLYYKGTADLNQQRVIAIVGTRNATEYGKKICEELIEGLKDADVLISSGMAYGIDFTAHRACLKNKIETIGVFAHGLDNVYPAEHYNTAQKMLERGGLLTEFMSKTNPDRENFPKRNRIVAGMSDATIVIEASEKGGALITADIASSYNRDVFAIPGKVNDTYSMGCNNLIYYNKAAMIMNAKTFLRSMNWEVEESKKKTVQKAMFVELTPDEEKLIDVIRGKENIGIDDISVIAEMPMSKASSLLLTMELSGLVKCLPGKRYVVN